MLRRISTLAAIAAAALPFASQADTMDYSHVEAGYVDRSFDIGDDKLDGDGIALRGSLPVLNNYFVWASYEDLGFERGVDATLLGVGAGGHWPLREKLDIVARAGIVRSNVDVGSSDETDSGFLLGARLRAELAPKFEVEGGFDYLDLDDQGNDTLIALEGRYFFMNQLAGGLSLQFGDDTTTLGVNVRVTF